MSSKLTLRALGNKLSGMTWEAQGVARIGRQGTLDVVLRDYTVHHHHAEIRPTNGKWILKDLANNALYPTLVNNVRLLGDEQEVTVGDVMQFGKVQVAVESIDEAAPTPMIATTSPKTPTPFPPLRTLPKTLDTGDELRITGVQIRIQAATTNSWDQALEAVAAPRGPVRISEQATLTLLRANHHLAQVGSLSELLQSILVDVVQSLQAQRGCILLLSPTTGDLELRAIHTPGFTATPFQFAPFSRTLANRCFHHGESMVCGDAAEDTELQFSRSVRAGAMSSIICALLRTPRRRIGILHLDRGPMTEPFTTNDLYLADAIAASVAMGIESAQIIEQQREQFIQTVTTLARAVEMRDQYTGDHTKRVTDYSLILAEELKLPALDRYNIQIGTPLHDIGKIGIDDSILRKPGKLTAGEYESMKTHTIKGAAMLDSVVNLTPMIPIVRGHHERWDGTGYPDRLAGEAIPLNARIVAVADAFDAMTSSRPYRSAMNADQAFYELVKKSNSHFDPKCVEAFLAARRRVEDRMRQKESQR